MKHIIFWLILVLMAFQIIPGSENHVIGSWQYLNSKDEKGESIKRKYKYSFVFFRDGKYKWYKDKYENNKLSKEMEEGKWIIENNQINLYLKASHRELYSPNPSVISIKSVSKDSMVIITHNVYEVMDENELPKEGPKFDYYIRVK